MSDLVGRFILKPFLMLKVNRVSHSHATLWNQRDWTRREVARYAQDIRHLLCGPLMSTNNRETRLKIISPLRHRARPTFERRASYVPIYFLLSRDSASCI